MTEALSFTSPLIGPPPKSPKSHNDVATNGEPIQSIHQTNISSPNFWAMTPNYPLRDPNLHVRVRLYPPSTYASITPSAARNQSRARSCIQHPIRISSLADTQSISW